MTYKELINFVRDELVLSGSWSIEDLPSDLEMGMVLECIRDADKSL
jgi:hypothetical protein